jgi:predicted  nucleic acid-binding Zn-ribbon protein
MYLESFRHLIEIESLKTRIREHNAILASEVKRITDLDTQRNKLQARITELQSEEQALHLKNLELTISTEEQSLGHLTTQLDNVKNDKELAATTHQIQTIKNSLALHEETYFAALDRTDKIHEELKDCKQFLAGSVDTREEISKDVEAAKTEETEKIFYLNARIASLLEQCNKSARDLYLSSEKTGVAFILDKTCSKCHMQVSSILKSSIEEGRSLDCCPSCGRFLIPETAKIY